MSNATDDGAVYVQTTETRNRVGVGEDGALTPVGASSGLPTTVAGRAAR